MIVVFLFTFRIIEEEMAWELASMYSLHGKLIWVKRGIGPTVYVRIECVYGAEP